MKFHSVHEVVTEYSPSWMMDVELTIHELGPRAATELMDPHVAWSVCLGCGAYRRYGYAAPVRMWGEHWCAHCIKGRAL